MKQATLNPFAYKELLKKVNKKIKNIKGTTLAKIQTSKPEYKQIAKILELINTKDIQQQEIDRVLKLPLNISDEEIYSLIKNCSKYTILNIDDIKSKQLLKRSEISLNYVEMNIKPINKGGVVEEAELTEMEKIYDNYASLYKNCLGLESEIKNQQERIEAYLASSKKTMLEEGVIYAICPITGELVSSNYSFNMGSNCVYRFVGKEVFYLGLSGAACTKHFIYIPKFKIIIRINKIKNQNLIDYIEILNKLNYYFIILRKNIFDYLKTEHKLKTVLIEADTIAHYLLNNLSGVEALKSSIIQVDKIIVRGSQFYGSIDKIFPELEGKNIEIVNGEQKLLFKKILEENLFVVKPCHYHYITEQLATRIYTIARKECSVDFLNHLEGIRNKHFPIIFITWRLHRRRWLSQIEGVINIINSLVEGYPNLGVVFDGYSRIASEEDSPELIEAMQQEKEAVKKVVNSVNPKVQIYDSIGCTIQESLIWASIVDFYLASGGSSGLVKVLWIANKPGVTHESAMLKEDKSKSSYVGESRSVLWRENSQMPLCIPKSLITDYSSNLSVGNWQNIDYDFDWRLAYKEILKLVPLLKRDGVNSLKKANLMQTLS